jgi:protein-tyrosine-phosphatase
MSMKRIHFICRGNVYRSRMAEAYLKSLELPNIEVISSGTVAEREGQQNIQNQKDTLNILKRHGLDKHAKKHWAQLTQSLVKPDDITICMNQRVYDEASTFIKFPRVPIIWGINDLGEDGKLYETREEIDLFSEKKFQDIKVKVDELVRAKLTKT